MRRRGTYEDLERLPEHLVGELIDGELIVSPRPRPHHALAATKIGAKLDPYSSDEGGGPGGWWILVEPELHLERDDVLVPDLAGWRRSRMEELPEEAGVKLPPDWVCEVLSPSTARVDRVRKIPTYAKNGVPWCWIVDAEHETIEVLKLDGEQWRVHVTVGGRERERIPPFGDVEIPLNEIWGVKR